MPLITIGRFKRIIAMRVAAAAQWPDTALFQRAIAVLELENSDPRSAGWEKNTLAIGRILRHLRSPRSSRLRSIAMRTALEALDTSGLGVSSEKLEIIRAFDAALSERAVI